MISLPANPLDRAERIARVRRYLAALGLKRWRALVFGSVGRGDSTAESDTDRRVISDELPADIRARLDLLFGVREVAPEIEAIGWREDDWARCERAGDPFLEVPKRDGLPVAP
ncbi:MAG TPA: hypothetical protein VNK91_14660 [Burkholderiaceae bacterium]|nr:hypothetical protein [Burkholderiaceae bacterium]